MRKSARSLEIAIGCFVAAPAFVIGGFATNASAQSTIAEVAAGGAGTYTIDNAEVVAILDSNASATWTTPVLMDSSGSIVDFRLPMSSYIPKVGDNIDITTKNSPFDGAPELSGTPTSVTVNSSGNPVPSPAVLTIAEFDAASTEPNVDSIVTLEGVTFAAGTPATLANNTDYTLTDATTNTAILYDYKSYSNVQPTVTVLNALGGGDAPPLDITGYVDDFNGVTNLYPLSAVAVPEPASLSVLALSGLALLGRRRKA
jgi:PEP-CTERM motif